MSLRSPAVNAVSPELPVSGIRRGVPFQLAAIGITRDLYHACAYYLKASTSQNLRQLQSALQRLQSFLQFTPSLPWHSLTVFKRLLMRLESAGSGAAQTRRLARVCLLLLIESRVHLLECSLPGTAAQQRRPGHLPPRRPSARTIRACMPVAPLFFDARASLHELLAMRVDGALGLLADLNVSQASHPLASFPVLRQQVTQITVLLGFCGPQLQLSKSASPANSATVQELATRLLMLKHRQQRLLHESQDNSVSDNQLCSASADAAVRTVLARHLASCLASLSRLGWPAQQAQERAQGVSRLHASANGPPHEAVASWPGGRQIPLATLYQLLHLCQILRGLQPFLRQGAGSADKQSPCSGGPRAVNPQAGHQHKSCQDSERQLGGRHEEGSQNGTCQNDWRWVARCGKTGDEKAGHQTSENMNVAPGNTENEHAENQCLWRLIETSESLGRLLVFALRWRITEPAAHCRVVLRLLLLMKAQLRGDLWCSEAVFHRLLQEATRYEAALQSTCEQDAATLQSETQQLLSPLESQQLLTSEIAQCLNQIRDFCLRAAQQDSAVFPHASLCMCFYKLSLNFQTAGAWRMYALTDSLQRILLSCLQQQCTLSARLLSLMLQYCDMLDHRNNAASRQKVSALTELLLRLEISHCRQGGHGNTAEAAQYSAELPQLLARELQTLPRAERMLKALLAETDGQERWQQFTEAVSVELALLIKGSHALKVQRLEALARVLLDVYQHSAEKPDFAQDRFCVLLLRAHRQLKKMLDQAAAWQEVSHARALINSLQTWLETRSVAGQPRGKQQSIEALLQDSRTANRRIRRLLRRLYPRSTTSEQVLLLELLRGQEEALNGVQEQLSCIYRILPARDVRDKSTEPV